MPIDRDFCMNMQKIHKCNRLPGGGKPGGAAKKSKKIEKN
jgi:hypothetical protein